MPAISATLKGKPVGEANGSVLILILSDDMTFCFISSVKPASFVKAKTVPAWIPAAPAANAFISPFWLYV